MKKQNKITAIIPARLSSSRLVEKHLYKANHKTMINHLVDRLKSIKVLDDIILATTTNSVDDLLVNEAIKLKINYFRGSEENVKQRVLLAGKKYSVDIICFITGDCPLIDPILIEQLIYTWLLNKNFAMVSYGCFKNYGVPNGMDSCVIKLKALDESYKMSKKREDLEHVSLHLQKNPNIFPSLFLYPPKNINYPELSLALDYYEDYLVIKRIINHFKNSKKFPTCLEIIEYVNKKKLFKLNSNLSRKIFF